MKIWMQNIQGEQIGGGFRFLENFRKGMQAEFVDRWEDCDLVFIAGVTMVERDDIEAAHTGGKPIVFRCDNIPRKSRNRRSRIFDNMRRYAEIADMVVYQ